MNEDTITTLVDLLGAEGVQGLVDALDGLAAEANAPEARAILEQLANAIEVAGPDAITVIAGVIAGANAGVLPEATGTNSRVMSDAVAALQVAEAAQRSEVHDPLGRLGLVMVRILVVLVRGLVGR